MSRSIRMKQLHRYVKKRNLNKPGWMVLDGLAVSNDDLDVTGVGKRTSHPYRVQQSVPFPPIIGLCEFQNLNLNNYLANVIVKIHENFLTAEACYHLLLMVSLG